MFRPYEAIFRQHLCEESWTQRQTWNIQSRAHQRNTEIAPLHQRMKRKNIKHWNESNKRTTKINSLSGEWSPLGTAATDWLIVPALGNYDNGEFGGMKIGRGSRSTRRKPAPAPLCPPQIPLDRTRAATVRSQRLTVWAMARPLDKL
jgi:hypothetical protein